MSRRARDHAALLGKTRLLRERPRLALRFELRMQPRRVFRERR